MRASVIGAIPSVRAAMLFGSRARGDSDEFSDVDIAVFVDAVEASTLVGLRAQLDASSPDRVVSFSMYSVASAETMSKNGSLFLWHLKLEGKRVYQRDAWLDSLFAELRPYPLSRALDDLLTLRTVLRDVQDSLRKTDLTILFEAATLFTVLRNIGNVTMAARGTPTFGRTAPITALANLMHPEFPVSHSDVEELMGAKLTQVGKAPDRDILLDVAHLLKLANAIDIVWSFAWSHTCNHSQES
jgi:hypothetical protein